MIYRNNSIKNFLFLALLVSIKNHLQKRNLMNVTDILILNYFIYN